MTLATGMEERAERNGPPGKRVYRVALAFEYDRGQDESARVLDADGPGRAPSLAEAEVIVDVGYAIRNWENFERIVVPLQRRLEAIGIKHVLVGARARSSRN